MKRNELLTGDQLKVIRTIQSLIRLESTIIDGIQKILTEEFREDINVFQFELKLIIRHRLVRSDITIRKLNMIYRYLTEKHGIDFKK